MIMSFLRKSWLHLLAWGAMLIYFLFAPDLFALAFMKNGKPLQQNSILPGESEQITFVVDGIEPYTKEGEKLYRIYGWALITPGGNVPEGPFERQVSLVSEDRKYFFSAEPEYRNPDVSSVTHADVDLDNLGFSFLIAEDVIKPGKYRIGVIFRDAFTGEAFYGDKPVNYLVKTPNTLRLEQK
jgi:hypothetical protein